MQREIFPCREFEPVDVPLDALMIGGKIDVYSEVTAKGYFDIDFRGGQLVMTAKGYVGLIPINDRVAIHVIPRFSIDNLLYILGRANATLSYIAGHTRTYAIAQDPQTDPAAMFGQRMVESLQHVKRVGLLRRYESTISDDDLRGELLLSESVGRFFSQGIRYRQIRRVTLHTVDVPENRLIKSVLRKLVSYYTCSNRKELRSLGGDAERLLMLFDRVGNAGDHPSTFARWLPRYISRLPNAHQAYATILWIAYLIESRRGVAVDKLGPITFDTFVVNLSEVFENYVRWIVTENVEEILPGARAENGNVKTVALFTQGQPQLVKPDIYLTQKGRALVALDAKYKPTIKAPDRYEILAFCEALQAKVAVVLSPSIDSSTSAELLGKTIGGIEFHVVKIDLGATDMAAAERAFVEHLKKIVSRIASSGATAVVV